MRNIAMFFVVHSLGKILSTVLILRGVSSVSLPCLFNKARQWIASLKRRQHLRITKIT